MEERRKQMSAHEARVDGLRKRVIEEILTDKCPQCKLAVLDFEACFAVRCRCQAVFCAWCFALCADMVDGHRHVAICSSNLNPNKALYSTVELFNKSRVIRQERKLAAFIADLDDKTVDDLLASLRTELTHVNVAKVRQLRRQPAVEEKKPVAPAPAAPPVVARPAAPRRRGRAARVNAPAVAPPAVVPPPQPPGVMQPVHQVAQALGINPELWRYLF